MLEESARKDNYIDLRRSTQPYPDSKSVSVFILCSPFAFVTPSGSLVDFLLRSDFEFCWQDYCLARVWSGTRRKFIRIKDIRRLYSARSTKYEDELKVGDFLLAGRVFPIPRAFYSRARQSSPPQALSEGFFCTQSCRHYICFWQSFTAVAYNRFIAIIYLNFNFRQSFLERSF